MKHCKSRKHRCWLFCLSLSHCSLAHTRCASRGFPRVPRATTSPAISREPINFSCRNCAAITEVDKSPWFSRVSCSLNSSREGEEKIRKRSFGIARKNCSHRSKIFSELSGVDFHCKEATDLPG